MRKLKTISIETKSDYWEITLVEELGLFDFNVIGSFPIDTKLLSEKVNKGEKREILKEFDKIELELIQKARECI